MSQAGKYVNLLNFVLKNGLIFDKLLLTFWKEPLYMPILESGEKYVETIYLLSLESDRVRGKDISNYMGVTRPSVSRALNSLRERGLVKSDRNRCIKLTEGGIILAKHIYDRTLMITRHFMSLGVDEKTAKEDAGKIERFISDATFNAMMTYQMRNRASDT